MKHSTPSNGIALQLPGICNQLALHLIVILCIDLYAYLFYAHSSQCYSVYFILLTSHVIESGEYFFIFIDQSSSREWGVLTFTQYLHA